MAYQVKLSDSAVKANAERESGFEPIPAGKYVTTIKDYEVVAAAGPASANSVLDVLNTQFRVEDGVPNAGRVLFGRIPLFQQWKPSGKPGAKYPDGAPAFDYFTFFGDVIGVSEEDLNAGRIPEFDSLLGKRVGIKVVVKDHPSKLDKNGNPLKVNEIRGYFAVKGGSVNASVAKAAGDPWANKIAVAPTADPWATTAAPAVPAATWAPDPADVAHAELATAGAPQQGF